MAAKKKTITVLNINFILYIGTYCCYIIYLSIFTFRFSFYFELKLKTIFNRVFYIINLPIGHTIRSVSCVQCNTTRLTLLILFYFEIHSITTVFDAKKYIIIKKHFLLFCMCNTSCLRTYLPSAIDLNHMQMCVIYARRLLNHIVAMFNLPFHISIIQLK